MRCQVRVSPAQRVGEWCEEYSSLASKTQCERAGIVVAMGRRGDAYDVRRMVGSLGSGLTLVTTGRRVPLR